MGSRSHALYFALLHDLSGHLDARTLSLLKEGVHVDDWPDITPSQKASLALAQSFYKKNVDDVASGADDAALAKFLSVNKRVGSWSLKLENSWDELLYGNLKQVLYEFFYPDGEPLICSSGAIMSHLRCGPGASIESPGDDLYSKLFSSKLTVTSKGLYRGYRGYIDGKPRWRDAELLRYQELGEPKVVKGNRLRFVPKTRDISRTICIEPTLNMCYQLGIGGLLENRLRAFFGIDLGVQPEINRELCRRGSLDGSFCTIDLESASDSLGIAMLKEIIPASQLAWFLCTRSPTSELPDGSVVELNMVSTMGNGYTFPLQTALFSSVVLAAARARGYNLERPRAASDATFGVFGDDIILPTACHYNRRLSEFTAFGEELWRDVIRLLNILGFVVNSKKSFVEGPFRESCGFDAFRGRDVRGVYIKTLKTTQSRFVAINLLNRWSAKTGIPLPETLHSLLKTVPKQWVPPWENDDSGIKVPKSLVPKLRICKHTQSCMYRVSIARTRNFEIKDNGLLGRKGYIVNPDGLILAFLNGSIRSHKISARSGVVLYENRFRVAPNWELHGADPGQSPGGRPWEKAVTLNHKLRVIRET